jgi:hypothetical protein
MPAGFHQIPQDLIENRAAFRIQPIRPEEAGDLRIDRPAGITVTNGLLCGALQLPVFSRPLSPSELMPGILERIARLADFLLNSEAIFVIPDPGNGTLIGQLILELPFELTDAATGLSLRRLRRPFP